MKTHKTRTERLDMDTVVSIKTLCSEYKLRLSHYYDFSGLNNPGHAGRLSYMAFLAAMAGGKVTPEQESQVARSLPHARQALRAAGRVPVMKEVLGLLRQVATAYEQHPEVLASNELATLRRIARKAAKRVK